MKWAELHECMIYKCDVSEYFKSYLIKSVANHNKMKFVFYMSGVIYIL